MAVSIHNLILTTTPHTECMWWEVKITDIGTDDEPKSLGYEFLDENDNVIATNMQPIRHKVNEWHRIFFNDLAEEILYSVYPNPQSNGFVAVPGSTNGIKIRIWENVTDTECDTTKNNIQTSGLARIINTSMQYNEKEYIIGGNYEYQNKYKDIELCFGGYDYYMINAQSSGYVHLVYRNSAGIIQSVTHNHNSGTSILRIPLDVEGATRVEIIKELGYNVYTIGIRNCTDTVNLLFRDPKQGWNGLCLNKDRWGIKTNQTEASMAEVCTSVHSTDSFQRLGLTVMQKESHEYIEASYRFNGTSIDYIKKFIASRDHLIAIKKWNGDDMFVKFILNSGDYTLYEDGSIMLNITGFISAKYNNNPTNIIN